MYYISASDVAAAIGKNPYKTSEEIFNKVTKSAPTPDEVAEQELQTLPVEIQEKVHTVLNTSKTTETSSTDAQKLVVDGVAGIDNAVVKEYITRKVSTQHGINNEAKTARAFNVKSDDTFYKYQLGDCVRLVGRIDGRLENDEETIVEIKNRRNRLFNRIPEYEMVQIHVYMFLTGARKCFFIERYNNSTKTYTVEYDEPYFTDCIMEPLMKFTKLLELNIDTV